MEAVNLDDPEAVHRVDPSSALASVGSLPDQVGAWVTADRWDWAGPAADRALVCGMGGSGVAGDLAAVLATGGPVVPHHSYGAPDWCGPGTFVVASSYSGNTEETLSGMRAAAAAGSHGTAVCSGGELMKEAGRLGWRTLEVPGGAMPRYAIGHLTIATLDPLTYGPDPFLRPFSDRFPGLQHHLSRRVTEWGPGAPEDVNQAKQIARRLDASLPVIWGGPGVTGVAAARWRCDLNENAKMLAHSAVIPELDHNEIIGLGPEGADRRPDLPISLVCLRDPQEDPRVATRFDCTVDEVRGSVTEVIEVRPQGDDPLTRFFDLVMLSGFGSVYLALLRGVDPAPIPSIDRLKQALSAP